MTGRGVGDLFPIQPSKSNNPTGRVRDQIQQGLVRKICAAQGLSTARERNPPQGLVPSWAVPRPRSTLATDT